MSICRAVKRFVRAAYRLIAATPLRGLLRTRMAQRLKGRLVEMPAELVPQVTSAMEDAGVRVWLVGGWGVDALLGRQTRRHGDLDLVFDSENDGERRAIEALAPLGFRVVGREPVVTHWWSERIALVDGASHVVDIHPVNGDEFIRTLEAHPAADGRPFTTGTIAGRAVACLSSAVQMTLHEGYEPTDVDRADVAVLREQGAP
jgi:lincosamide nucleotidyltransferase A/C/D/E